MARQYILADITSQRSRLNGVTMWRFTWYGLDDGVVYETTADSSYRNFNKSGWNHIVENTEPWGVYEGLTRTTRTTQDGLPIITADSRPSLVWRCESREQALQLIEADQRSRDPRQNLFEVQP